MARKWSGFVPQNLATKEEWEMLEACETEAKRKRAAAEACEVGAEACEKGLESRDSSELRVSFRVAKDK
jgi:hypothetical protein